MFKAAIFDLDGTLVDSLELHLRSFLNVCKRHSIPVERKFVIDRFGMTVKEIFSDILSSAGEKDYLDMLAGEKSAEFLRIASGIKTLPGALELLSELRGRGIKVAVATGNRQEDMRTILHYSSLPVFDAYIGAEDVVTGKPSPDVFLKAAEKLSVAPEECVVFEDAVLGLRAARNAGMKNVAVLTGLAKREELEAEFPDLFVSSLEGITFGRLTQLWEE